MSSYCIFCFVLLCFEFLRKPFSYSYSHSLSEQIDKSSFTGIPCAAPCWHGLEVGKSSESDVMSTLPTLTFINQDTIAFNRHISLPSLDLRNWSQGIMVFANCVYPNKQCLTMSVVDDVLTEIVIIPNYSVTVDEAIEYLDYPDYVGYQNLGAEKIVCGVYMIWTNKHLVLFTLFEGYKSFEKNCHVIRETHKIPSNITISEIRYVSTEAIENLMATGTGEFFEFSGVLPEQ